MEKVIEIITHSAKDTIELGKNLASALQGGEVVALIGDLGSGKTHLIKGIAIGLNAPDPTKVCSPTFVLVNEYSARDGNLTLYHIDAYRLNSLREFELLGFEDFCRPDAIVLVEWADKVLPALSGLNLLRIELSHAGQDQRRIRIVNPTERIQACVQKCGFGPR
ncbi:tRNA (adenosine(37)-N6)-threonylcarbamoyltransferase complex ATPase subunit type 1 TsaE [Anaerohalosphaeraceae bacterium U12dextr]